MGESLLAGFLRALTTATAAYEDGTNSKSNASVYKYCTLLSVNRFSKELIARHVGDGNYSARKNSTETVIKSLVATEAAKCEVLQHQERT